MKKDMVYSCNAYRQEMILMGLRKRLERKDLTEKERNEIKKEMEELEACMGLD